MGYVKYANLNDKKTDFSDLISTWIIVDSNKIIINSSDKQKKTLDEIRLIKYFIFFRIKDF